MNGDALGKRILYLWSRDAKNAWSVSGDAVYSQISFLGFPSMLQFFISATGVVNIDVLAERYSHPETRPSSRHTTDTPTSCSFFTGPPRRLDSKYRIPGAVFK